MALSLSDFNKWRASRKVEKTPKPEEKPIKDRVVQADPGVTISGVVQANPGATIGGVVQAKPIGTIRGVVQASPTQTIKVKPYRSISPIDKDVYASPDALGPVKPKESTILSKAEKAAEFLPNLLADIFVRGPAKSGAAMVQSVVRSSDQGRRRVGETFEPDENASRLEKIIQKELFGGKTKELAGVGKDILPSKFEKGPVPFLTGAVLSLSDFTGAGKGKNAVKALAKTKDVGEAANILKKLNIADDIISNYAPILAKTSKEADISKIISRIDELQKTTTIAKPAVKQVVAPKISSVDTALERGFISNVKKNANTQARQVLADRVSGEYTSITNKETMAAAQALINRNVDEALRVAKETRPTAKSIATAQALADKFAREGNFEQAIDLVETTSKKLTQSGQAVQAASMFGRLTPEGVLRYAQRQFDQVNDLIKVESKKLKLTPDLVKRLRTQAENLQKLPEGSREKVVETAKMLKTIADEIPTNFGKKISLVQTMGQLLNPKTIARNIIGNTGFAIGENVKDVVATPLDWFVSKFTGERTKALPSLTAQARGFKKGLKEGFQDAWLGIDTSAAATQFDLPKGQVFKNKMMNGLERVLGVVLKSPDRAAYQAAFENSLNMQMKLKKVTEATPEMLHIAHLDGLYRTFQDDSVAAKIFMKIKDGLNAGKDFGLGDIVIKYPKTPGNLLARGIDYSPAGFLKSMVELAKPLFGHTFDQRAFVESASRAFTGTATLVGSGILMHKLGLITGKRSDDGDINALQRDIGLGQYKLNLSGLARFVMSGFDPDEAKLKFGDKTISYDWLQPSAIGVSVGANIDEMMSGSQASIRNNPLAALIVSLGEGVDTLGEQPLVQGITRPFKYSESISEAVLNALQGVPTSFIPTFLGQVRQVADKNQRNIQDPDYLQETLNLVKNKIPGLSEFLPKKYSPLGQELKNENSIIETFVSPGYVDKYEFTPEQKMVLDIYNQTGLKTQAPRLVSPTQTVNGKTMKLTGEQQSKMQEAIGKLTQARFAGLVNNPKFQKMSDEKKASTMAGIMSDIFTAAKYVQLGHRPKRLSAREKKYIRIMRGS